MGDKISLKKLPADLWGSLGELRHNNIIVWSWYTKLRCKKKKKKVKDVGLGISVFYPKGTMSLVHGRRTLEEV